MPLPPEWALPPALLPLEPPAETEPAAPPIAWEPLLPPCVEPPCVAPPCVEPPWAPALLPPLAGALGWSSLPEQAALNNRLSPAQAASHGRHFTGAGAPAALGDAWRAGRAERSEAERVTRGVRRARAAVTA